MADEKIYSAICAVMEDIGAVGKNDINKTQGFRYRGIDAVMNALSPAMIKHKVFCVPELLEQTREERQSAKGNTLIYSICRMRYHFYTTDGSSVEAVTVGEGMDSGDKATNKAMAIAFKYACFQTFCIPTEELMDDPDRESPEVKGKKKAAQKPAQKKGDGQNAAAGKTSGKASGDAGGKEKPSGSQPVASMITAGMMQTIRKELDRTGIEEKKILSTFGLKFIEDMSAEQYQSCMKKFKVTPDKPGSKEGQTA